MAFPSVQDLFFHHARHFSSSSSSSSSLLLSSRNLHNHRPFISSTAAKKFGFCIFQRFDSSRPPLPSSKLLISSKCTDSLKVDVSCAEHTATSEDTDIDIPKPGFSSILIEDSDSDEDESDDETDEVEYNINELVGLEDDSLEDEEEAIDSPSVSAEDDIEHKKERRRRVQELYRRKQSVDDYAITVDDLASLYDFRIDKFQRLAIQGFLKGSSVVVCAPTSSGKTLIAESAATATLAMGRRLFYTTPLKALSNQKLREFRDMFGEENVGLVTGDAAVNRDAPIVIMTTEILRNMLYQTVGTLDEGGQLQDVSAIVLDEVHYLSDISRGTVWEETVIYCPKEVQLICLSATVANADELAGWIAQVHGPTELVTSRRRPIPLTWHFSTRYSLSYLLNEEATAMNRRLSLTGDREVVVGDSYGENDILAIQKRGEARVHGKYRHFKEPQPVSDEELQFLRRRQVPRVEETLKQLNDQGMLPAIWFIFSRKGCDTAIRYVQNLQLLSDDEKRQVCEALATFQRDCPDAVRESAVSSLLRGFASHHAGCLPLWKAFIEELFQKGLVKVVFATETLAAGINMPARTTVLSSLSKRGDTGHSLLSSNAMLQMAGRAGRRGLDERGHVVVVQTPFEGAEEACKLLFAGPDPLVSQFTASYGMVLNLLSAMKSTDGKLLRRGRTLEEARALIEQSFGNYIGNDMTVELKQQVSKLEERIVKLQRQTIPDVRSKLTNEEIDEYMKLKECLKVERQCLKGLRDDLDQKRLAVIQPLLVEALKENLPFICIRYNDDRTGFEEVVSAVCIDILPETSFLVHKLLVDSPNSEDVDENEVSPTLKMCTNPDNGETQSWYQIPYFVALGSNNSWYAFSATSVKGISRAGLSNASVNPVESCHRLSLMEKVPGKVESWKFVGKKGSKQLGSVWSSQSSVDTWCWSTNVPAESSMSEEMQVPLELLEAEVLYKKQRKKISRIKTEMRGTRASREHQQALGMEKLKEAKIAELEKKKSQMLKRISQMQPSGWKEFLQVVKVLEDVGAITSEPHEMLQLGETAASCRGVNELWLALAFSNPALLDLNPAQLASICASFVSEGIKIRFDVGLSDIYKPSSAVEQAIEILEEKRQWLLEVQNKHGVSIACDLDDQLVGLVEAWASGVTWKELMMDCGMDEGDLARLLRRSIDLLLQVPFLPHVNPALHKAAKSAADVMDRSPISELIT